MLIFLLGANRPGAKRLGGRNDQGRNDLGRNAAGAKRLGGELDLGRNDPDSIKTILSDRILAGSPIKLTILLLCMGKSIRTKYSKTCLKQPPKETKNWLKTVSHCNTFDLLSHHLPLKSLFCLFLSGHLKQVFLYHTVAGIGVI